ncbi:MAG: helix-turn-helix transcriptional regulator [Firmicutes bacterium]|nr:helix-turn-helix transcriptional regulator [Bacillota bacterium]
MKKKHELPECPDATTFSLIGSKWKLFNIRNRLVKPYRFNELLNSLEGISHKFLADSLKSMEKDGIIEHIDFKENQKV